MTPAKARILFGALILAVTAGATVMRVGELARRPMHVDEAVHAEKFRRLYELGTYSYNPEEFHGPTLNYLTLPAVWLSRAGSFAETTEAHYRIVPVVFGVLLVAMIWAISDGLGRGAAICAGVLAAISPAMVFYSRYYVQETLLVTFTFGAIVCGWRYVRSGSPAWAMACGAFIGLMHATKETSVIALAAMAVSIVIARAAGPRTVARRSSPMKAWHLLCAVAVACLVSVTLFSSFFTQPAGPVDSLRALTTYFQRAGGQGSSALHKHPWHYYLRMLAFYRDSAGPWWSEAPILLLAVLGLVVAVTRKGLGAASASLVRFIAVYTVLMTVVYSAIPYKTPWCMLGFLHGLILLGGVGAVAFVRWMPKAPLKVIAVLLLLAGAAHLARQAYLGSYRFYADRRNPYVYAHTSRDLLRLVARVRQIAALHPDGHDMQINIITHDDDYWPLPWYLRRFNRDRIGHWPEAPQNADAPVVIAGVAGGAAADVEAKLRDEYQTEHFALRPGVLLRLYVNRTLWRQFLENREKARPK